MVVQHHTNDSALVLKSCSSLVNMGISPEASSVSDAAMFPQSSQLLSFEGIFICKWNLFVQYFVKL